MMKLSRAADSIFVILSVNKTPAQIEAERWLEDNPDDFVTWNPKPGDYTYSDFPDYAESAPSEPTRSNDVVSGINANWPESVGHPAEFHPTFTNAGYRLHIPRHNSEAPSYSRSTEPPIPGSLSGSHSIWPSHDSSRPWTGLNIYGPWSGGVGNYTSPEEALQGAEDDERRYIEHHVADRDRNL